MRKPTLVDFLVNLHEIFPHGVEKWQRSALNTREATKKAYMKTLLLVRILSHCLIFSVQFNSQVTYLFGRYYCEQVHPDRLPNADVETKLLANSVFSILRESFNAFMQSRS